MSDLIMNLSSKLTITVSLFILFSPDNIFPQENDLIHEYDLIKEWDILEKGVRDSNISKNDAEKKLKGLVPLINEKYRSIIPEMQAQDEKWTFPVEGGNRTYIGGKKGEGYHPQTPRPAYDFFDGNKHGGHPAHDIFMPHDKNNDCIDDKTGNPAYIVAMAEGVVLSTNEEWKAGHPRGGKYIWIYNPVMQKFFYYAHLRKILVKSGQIVKKGERIGTMGKTGFKPHKSCHLHMMVLDYNEGKMTPYNFYLDY